MRRLLNCVIPLSILVAGPASGYPCIQQDTDTYFMYPTDPAIFDNFTAHHVTFENSCGGSLNVTICYQSPTTFANGNTYECLSNYPKPQNLSGPYLSKNYLMSAAVVTNTRKYVMTCSTNDGVCNRALQKLTSCNSLGESCIKNLNASRLKP